MQLLIKLIILDKNQNEEIEIYAFALNWLLFSMNFFTKKYQGT